LFGRQTGAGTREWHAYRNGFVSGDVVPLANRVQRIGRQAPVKRCLARCAELALRRVAFQPGEAELKISRSALDT
jgi:hypothetical protein